MSTLSWHRKFESIIYSVSIVDTIYVDLFYLFRIHSADHRFSIENHMISILQTF